MGSEITSRAARSDRGRLDRYIASLNAPSVVSGYPKWSDDQKKALWLNAYNALVLQTDLLGEIAICQLDGSLTQTAYALLSDVVTIRRRQREKGSSRSRST